jgi:hypothetical protein
MARGKGIEHTHGASGRTGEDTGSDSEEKEEEEEKKPATGTLWSTQLRQFLANCSAARRAHNTAQTCLYEVKMQSAAVAQNKRYFSAGVSPERFWDLFGQL